MIPISLWAVLDYTSVPTKVLDRNSPPKNSRSLILISSGNIAPNVAHKMGWTDETDGGGGGVNVDVNIWNVWTKQTNEQPGVIFQLISIQVKIQVWWTQHLSNMRSRYRNLILTSICIKTATPARASVSEIQHTSSGEDSQGLPALRNAHSSFTLQVIHTWTLRRKD